MCPGTTRRFAPQPNAVKGFCRLPNRQLLEALAPSPPCSQSVSPLPSASHPSCRAHSQPALWQPGSSRVSGAPERSLFVQQSVSPQRPPSLENRSRSWLLTSPLCRAGGPGFPPPHLPALGEQTDPKPPFPPPTPAQLCPVSFLSQRQVFLPPHRVFPSHVTQAWGTRVTVRHFNL